jgi:hypothetical protein
MASVQWPQEPIGILCKPLELRWDIEGNLCSRRQVEVGYWKEISLSGREKV